MLTDTNILMSLTGRVLLGGLFVVGGIRHFFIVPILTQAIAARGVPAPKLVLLLGTAFQVIAGLLFVFGIFLPWTAFGLIVFTTTASIMLLNFWSMEGEARENTKSVWLSNLAIVGGLLITAANSL
jgi:putative oxidoreductase